MLGVGVVVSLGVKVGARVELGSGVVLAVGANVGLDSDNSGEGEDRSRDETF
jgi:hypothetical protein